MTGKLCFIDTETTSLRPDRRAWEIAVIDRVPVTVKHRDRPDTCETEDREHRWYIQARDLDLGNADPVSLKIGRFHDRHPDYVAAGVVSTRQAHPEREILEEVEAACRGAHLVGAVPNFDAEVLANRMRVHGICPSWHYHLIDVETLAVGYLQSSAAYGGSPAGSQRELTGSITALPWDSEALSKALGVDPEDFDRHTALGDARWARAIYDLIIKEQP